jgi:hypothetical protein
MRQKGPRIEDVVERKSFVPYVMVLYDASACLSHLN